MKLRKIGVLVAGGALVASLAACDFTADGHLECHTQADGKVLCAGSGTGTPLAAPTTQPPVTDPPPTTEQPPPSSTPPPPPPVDPNAGKAAATVTAAQTAANKVTVTWATERTDITGWYVSRDGVDTNGSGAWGTELPTATKTQTFDLLRAGGLYNFTLVGHTAAGDLPAITKSVTLTDATPPATDPGTTPTGTSAAERFGWGAPTAAGTDEFNGTSLDLSKWGVPGECWPGNSTVVGGRCASHNAVANGYLRETGTADGKTGYVSSKFGQKYGRWEVRARVTTAAPGGNFHPVLITWPDDDRFPQGGEYDYLEVNSNSTKLESYMHHPTASGVVQDYYSGPNVDLGQWHNYGFEWSPTGLTGYIDGQVWFHNTDPAAQAPNPMHQTIQLDNFVGTSGMATVYFDADWARAYPLR